MIRTDTYIKYGSNMVLIGQNTAEFASEDLLEITKYIKYCKSTSISVSLMCKMELHHVRIVLFMHCTHCCLTNSIDVLCIRT